MALHRRMKDLLRRLTRKRPKQREEINLDGFAPLVHLIEPAEPDENLMARIEQGIDARDGAGTKEKRNGWPAAKALIGVFLLGLLVGVFVTGLVQPRQKIVAKTDPSSPWVALGAVTLHGPALRDFVRAKCHDQTHFFITMHGFHDQIREDPHAAPPLLMESGEKILMDCIF